LPAPLLRGGKGGRENPSFASKKCPCRGKRKRKLSKVGGWVQVLILDYRRKFFNSSTPKRKRKARWCVFKGEGGSFEGAGDKQKKSLRKGKKRCSAEHGSHSLVLSQRKRFLPKRKENRNFYAFGRGKKNPRTRDRISRSQKTKRKERTPRPGTAIQSLEEGVAHSCALEEEKRKRDGPKHRKEISFKSLLLVHQRGKGGRPYLKDGILRKEQRCKVAKGPSTRESLCL